MDELVGVWWNGHWARMLRRDVYLRHHLEPERWIVEARAGGPDGESATWESDTEDAARAVVSWYIENGGDGWRETTRAYRSQQQMREDRTTAGPGDPPS